MSDSQFHRYSRSNRLAYWAGAILIITFGVYLTYIHFMETEWLSRAGCLVVMVGIWSGIGGVFQERLILRRTKRLRRNALTEATARLGEESADSEQIEQQLADINGMFDNQITEASQHLRYSIGMLEVSLLITGTFLWGFGDLIIR